MVELLIIGGGPAGLTAALYAARAGKQVLVLEQDSPGGQILQAPQVENYPGVLSISGMELGDRLCAQAMEAGATIDLSPVLSLSQWDGGFHLETGDGPLEAKAVIYAGGAKPRPLGLPEEEAFLGCGVSYCALCDGPFYAGCDVAVVGGGNSACGEAAYLSTICRSVTIIHRRTSFRADAAVLSALDRCSNVSILTPATVQALQGKDSLEQLLVQLPDGIREIPVSGLFVALGRQADCGFLGDLVKTDASGFIETDALCRTAAPGLFAAGDCRAKAVRQLTTAAADGTIAAISACQYLSDLL